MSPVRLRVLVPTLPGREASLQRMRASVERTAPQATVHAELRGSSWPAALNLLVFDRLWDFLRPDDVLVYGSDDFEFEPGWAEAVTADAAAGRVPSPVFLQPDGTPWAGNDAGVTGTRLPFSRVPVLTGAMAKTIGPWPEELYYCGDCWAGAVASRHGWPCVLNEAYRIVHHWEQVGRARNEALWPQSAQLLQRIL